MYSGLQTSAKLGLERRPKVELGVLESMNYPHRVKAVYFQLTILTSNFILLPLPSWYVQNTLKNYLWEYNYAIGSFNSVFSTINMPLSLWAVSTQQPIDGPARWTDIFTSPALLATIGAYSIGILTDRGCLQTPAECVQTCFHRQGQALRWGLFSLATNINYGGYDLWRVNAYNQSGIATSSMILQLLDCLFWKSI